MFPFTPPVNNSPTLSNTSSSYSGSPTFSPVNQVSNAWYPNFQDNSQNQRHTFLLVTVVLSIDPLLPDVQKWPHAQ